jgi:hypothetical protein
MACWHRHISWPRTPDATGPVPAGFAAATGPIAVCYPTVSDLVRVAFELSPA